VPAAQAAPVVAGDLESASHATAGSAIVVNSRVKHQDIDGFGFAQPFRRNELVRALTPDKQREILDLWMSRTKGAGFSILRLGIGSSPAGSPYDLMVSIQPEDPGGPDAPPNYTWDGEDNSQVWLAKEAKKYGVKRIFGDAWSAPGYMKDNDDDRNGGALCGLTGVTCADGQDWRLAYAKYLVAWAKFYKQEGIKITDLGFTNEPDFTASYASMRFTPEQAVEFSKILGPLAARAGIDLVCCDSFGWNEAKAYSAAIEADPLARFWVKTHTGHNYASTVDTGPLPTRRPTWMSEWNPNGDRWNEAWDDNSGFDGWTIANSVHDALAISDVSAYVYWFGVSRGATRALLQIDQAAGTYAVSKRLWAMAAYSRFIRPGAVRVDVQASDPALRVTAFDNADGSQVLEIINTSTSAVTTSLKGVRHGRATVYLTDNTNSLTPTALTGKSITIQPRSLTTVVYGRR